MKLTENELKKIIQQTQSLYGSLDKLKITNNIGTDDAPIVRQRLKKWLENSANGDNALFEKRLSIEGLNYDSAKKVLAKTESQIENTWPSWIGLLNEILAEFTAFSSERLSNDYFTQFSFLNPKKPLPFEEFFIPIIILARKKLQGELGEDYHMFSPQAHQVLEHFLLHRLSEVSAQTLMVEFNTYLASLQFIGVNLSEIKKAKTSRIYYFNFINYLHKEGFQLILTEYCMLARFIALIFYQWLETSSQLIKRLCQDLKIIQEVFGNTQLSKVIGLSTNLSDPHHNGQSVSILTFEADFKLVYKPKDLGLEAQYFNLIQWINQQDDTLHLKAVKVIERENYGWVEFVPNSSMESEEQPANYFYRSGMLLGLIYLFGGTDFHSENIIACGENPVLIDLETFIHPELKLSTAVRDLLSAADFQLYESVMKSHFLPNMEKVNDQYMDYTALGKADDTIKKTLTWKYVNTDGMEYKYEKKVSISSKKSPRYKQCEVYPETYVSEIIKGFSYIYHFFSNLNPYNLPSEIYILFQQRNRFIFRSTSSYTSAFEQAFFPECMKSGVDFCISLDVLCQKLLKDDCNSNYWDFYKIEMDMMWNLDIPYFWSRGNSNSLLSDSKLRIAECFDGSALERFIKKLSNLSDEDLKNQLNLIAASIHKQKKDKKNKQNQNLKSAVFDEKELLKYAKVLAETIQAQAIYNKANEPSWIVIKGVDYEKKKMIESIKFGLYDGSLGIAIFFAAMYKNTLEKKYKDFAYKTIALTARWLQRVNGDIIIHKVGIGGTRGIGSIIYAYTVLAKLLNDSSLINQAQLAASFLKKEHIDADQIYDITDGCSGTMLGLLALYACTRDQLILNKIIYCGNHLLENRTLSSNHFRVWENEKETPALTGFSHGTAGISYALSKLYEITKEEKYLVAVKEAIDYENSNFDEKNKNWIDFRFYNDQNSEKPFFTTAWCNGAPGIGLARIGVLNTINTEVIRNDIQNAMEATQCSNFGRLDHLCCGNVGRAEVLLSAGLKMGKSAWKEEAINITTHILQRAISKDGVRPTFSHDWFNPTLYKGYAGLGYHLLRLHNPDSIPCILSFET